MRDLPHFSIIIPVYNTEAFLHRCIQSILEQNFCDYELILVNDGSTDSSPLLCDLYAAQDDRITVLHKANGGVSSARNAGLSVARGNWIWFIDSDDYIFPHALNELHELQQTQEAQLYVFNQKKRLYYSGSLNSLMEKFYFNYELGFSPWNKVFKRQIIADNSLFFDTEEEIGEDMLFNLHYYTLINTVYFSGREFYMYDIREESAMNSYSSERHRNHMRIYGKIYRKMNSIISQNHLRMLYFLSLDAGLNLSRMGGLSKTEQAKLIRFYGRSFPGNSYLYQKALLSYLRTKGHSFKSNLRSWILFTFCI